MLLIFSPTVYLIPHVQEPCYVGMRGGLGKTVQSARRTLMKDHNFTVYFDTTFTKEHLDCVVYLRIAMKCCFRRELMENSEWRRKKLPCHQRSARRILSWLLDQPYKFVHPLMNANAGAVREKHHNLLDMYPGFNWMTVGSWTLQRVSVARTERNLLSFLQVQLYGLRKSSVPLAPHISNRVYWSEVDQCNFWYMWSILLPDWGNLSFWVRPSRSSIVFRVRWILKTLLLIASFTFKQTYFLSPSKNAVVFEPGTVASG